MRRAPRWLAVVLTAAVLCTFGTAVAKVAKVQNAAPAAAPTPAPAAEVKQGIAALAATPAAVAEQLFAVATFGAGGTAQATRRASALIRLGLEVLPMRNLPLAIVSGTKSQLQRAVSRGLAGDVYPDQRLELHSAVSTAAVRSDVLRAAGVTGKGVGVAIVDSGIDATHPDLADHVTHNMKLVGPEHLDLLGPKRLPDELFGTIVVPVDQLPYNNSDTSSGHGTHVAGIVAADAHTSPDQIGVAPDANLIGYGAGDLLHIFTVLAAFDDILEHKDEWGIRVVNNSWGTAGRMFDPGHPINVATKALHDAGLTVVFSAGNGGEEGTMNTWALAPWVIAAASATTGKELSPFSSGGFEFDNSEPVAVPDDGHVHFDGDRIGLYHPDVSAPGSDIVSSGTITGIGTLSPSLPGGTATLSGTSMASPHIAGAAALLLEANPNLTPDQVRLALQVTAVPHGGEAPFYRAGYGFIDVAAAVDLVKRADFGPPLLDTMQAAADKQVQDARAHKVRATDMWRFSPLLVTVSGLDSRTFTTVVDPSVKAIRAVVSYPSLELLGVNPFDWQITVIDADGRALGSSTASAEAGISKLTLDLAGMADVAYGTWKIQLDGVLGVADTDALLGNVVTLTVAQLEPLTVQGSPPPAAQTFVPAGAQPLYFQSTTTASPLGLGLLGGGCDMVATAPKSTMGGARTTATCSGGYVGYPITYAADAPAEFVSSAPLGQDLVVGGASSLTLYLADAASSVWTAAGGSEISYTLEAVDGAGQATAIASGQIERLVNGADEVGSTPVRADYGFTVPPKAVPQGSLLRLRLRFSGAWTATLQMLFGGAYGDAGLSLGTGRFE